MTSLLRPSWWLQMFLSTFVTMIFLYIIKKFASTYNVPVVSTIASEI